MSSSRAKGLNRAFSCLKYVTAFPQLLQATASGVSLQGSVCWNTQVQWVAIKGQYQAYAHTTENGETLWIKATQSIIYFTLRLVLIQAVSSNVRYCD